ncbi:MAG: threonine/serine dehydratase [Thermomicrobiales bacterium]
MSGHVKRTPIFSATRFGQRAGCELLLKAEQFQRTGSFKVRGALNKISCLTDEERERGVIAVSAGNHAQGVAWAASTVGVRSVIVMAASASETKIAATRGYGAEVVLVDGGISEAFEAVKQMRAERGMTLVHPFDDPLIIAGQGTLGLEIVEDVPDADAIVVGIGGGGLVSGLATAVKTRKPDIKVIGVEPAGADVMRRSWDAGRPLEMTPQTIADGLASPVAGTLTYALTRDLLHDIVTVTDDEIISAVKDLLIYCKLYAEPAGAAPVAALLSGKLDLEPGAKVVAVISGGNFDLDALKAIL